MKHNSSSSSASSSAASPSASDYDDNLDSPEEDELILKSDFNSHSSFVSDIKWHPKESSQVITKDPHYVTLWSIDNDSGDTKEISKIELAINDEDENDYSFTGDWSGGGVSWSHCESDIAAVVSGSQIQIVDFRTNNCGIHISNIHPGGAQDVDMNPNKAHTVVTAGNDRTAKIWDLRKTTSPLCILSGHTHWTSCVRYNPVHDQLLLSGGTDQIVNIWRAASVASTPWLGTQENNTNDDPPDINAKIIDQHEDSVYAVAWNYKDPWTACSLSYDGRIVHNRVPSTEKYKILL